jgi:ArsR family transcriptional regulator, arsenate/arsenite/antimonite-responsive transcriptional repressor
MTELLIDDQRTTSKRQSSTVNGDHHADGSRPDLPDLSHHVIEQLAKVFKLLSDETRLRVLLYLTRNDELHVRALCELLGQSQPAVSHHLALLRVEGLIESRREGKHNFYRIVPERVQELLDMVFANVPEAKRRIRIEDYVLSYAPPA